MAAMLGFIKNQNGVGRIAPRIFETRMYNFYLASADMQNADIYKASQWDKNQFVAEGRAGNCGWR